MSKPRTGPPEEAMRSAEEYRRWSAIVGDIRTDMSVRFNAVEGGGNFAPRVPVVVISDIRNKMGSVASMLREAAEMKEVLDNILRAVDSKELLTGPVERARAILGGESHD